MKRINGVWFSYPVFLYHRKLLYNIPMIQNPYGKTMRSYARGTKAVLSMYFNREGVRSTLLFYHQG